MDLRRVAGVYVWKQTVLKMDKIQGLNSPGMLFQRMNISIFFRDKLFHLWNLMCGKFFKFAAEF